MKANAESSSLSFNYSSFNPVILEKRGRVKMAKQIYTVLKEYLKGKSFKNLDVLDVGCSSGIISNFLSKHFKKVYGIDNDASSVNYAKKTFKSKNLRFKEADAIETGFKDGVFDVVIANQIYYCFKKPERFFSELKRVVKKGGIVFLGARNKYTLWDAQYHLPLLSFMPRFLANFYVKTFGRSDKFDAEYRSFWQLEKLCKDFEVFHYTPIILANPKKYGFTGLMKFGGILRFIPEFFWEEIEPTLPNFIWILRKPS